MRLPTQLTVLRIVLAAVFFVLFGLMEPPQVAWASLVFVVAAVTDWWDGHLARLMKATTPLGAFLDPLADKLLTGAALVAFAWQGLIPMWMVLIVLARDAYLTVLRTVAESMQMPVATSYIAKVKTFVQMSFIVLVLAAMLFVKSIVTPSILLWPMMTIALLTVASGLHYSYQNWPLIRSLIFRYFLRRPGQETI
jgi:CDP-diacylglycerol---glycerol-3-phosphate 3-phosphatidyltransferase